MPGGRGMPGGRRGRARERGEGGKASRGDSWAGGALRAQRPRRAYLASTGSGEGIGHGVGGSCARAPASAARAVRRPSRLAPDHHFEAVIVRSQLTGGMSVWTETRVRQGGSTLFRLEPGHASTRIECRSGSMVGWSTNVKGGVVNVLHPDRLPIADVDLALVSLQSLATTWPPPTTELRER